MKKQWIICLMAIALAGGQHAVAEPDNDAGRFGPGGPGGGPGMHERLLDEDERQALREAHEAVKDDEDVQAAREALEEARRNFMETLREALIQENPDLEPVLDKIKENGPPSKLGKFRKHRQQNAE